MTETEPEPEVVEITVQTNSEKKSSGRKHRRVMVPQNQLEIWDEEAEKRGMNRSSLIRVYAAAGRKMLNEYDPNEVTDDGTSPLEQAITKHVPVGQDSAQSIEEITEEVVKEVKEEVWDVLIEEDSINRKGSEFYRQ